MTQHMPEVPTLSVKYPLGYEENSPTAGEIWEKLSKINVNEHTQDRSKGGRKLTYLSWTWAYQTMMENYPEFHYEVGGCTYEPDGSVMTHVMCSIGLVSREMWLPVMDKKSKIGASEKNPDSREISDTIMRCLVKCIAMFGLGVYIYAGEDVPPKESEAKAAPAAPRELTKEVLDGYAATCIAAAVFIEGVESAKELQVYFKEHKDTFKRLKQEVPHLYEQVDTTLKAKQQEFAKKEGK